MLLILRTSAELASDGESAQRKKLTHNDLHDEEMQSCSQTEVLWLQMVTVNAQSPWRHTSSKPFRSSLISVPQQDGPAGTFNKVFTSLIKALELQHPPPRPQT